jgi:CHAD domain-containing protein
MGPRKAKPATIARNVSAAEALSANLVRAAEDIAWNGACALTGSDPEAVHQLRVALRRLRAILSLYKKLLPQRERAILRDLARAVNAPLGRARDMDVLAGEMLAPAMSAMPDDGDLAALKKAAEAERAARWDAAREALRGPEFAQLVAAAERTAAAVPARDAEAAAILADRASAFAAGVLRRRHKKLRRAGRRLRGMGADERHALRIAAKKQRYGAELFASLFPGARAARYARALARVQSALGTDNDATVAPRELESLRARMQPVAFARGAALVLGFHAALAGAREKRTCRAWKKFKSTKTFWRGT